MERIEVKKGILIYNPQSGDRLFTGLLDYVLKRFQEKGIYIYLYRLFESPLDLKEIIKNEKFDFAVFCGGDGTLHSCINLFLSEEVNIPFGVIPVGTSNDFAGCLDIKGSDDAIDKILNGKKKYIDVGFINKEKYFLSTFAGGMFAGIAFETERDLKETLGPMAYYITAVSDVINKKPFELEIEINGKIHNEKAILFLVVNGKNAAGFTNILEKADLSDGKMEIIVIKDCLHIDIPMLFLKIFNSGFKKDKNVVIYKGEKCKIRADKAKITTTIDGEEGIPLPCEIEVLRNKIEVFM